MAKELNLVITIDEKTETDSYSRITLQPLDRGFGITVGNALRRVLLTSIPGAAITNIRIDGVLHEFSAVDGVREDVADIIQNLKGVRFKLEESNPEKVTLHLEGPSTFTAKDVQEASDQFKVLNPDLYITELVDGAKLDMEIRIGVGVGYVPSERNILPNAPVGTLALDSIFNPVKKVTFKVTPVPGAKEPLEILTLDIYTDGSITPKDALSYSSSILIDHFKVVESISKPEVLEVTEIISDEALNIRKLLKLTIDEMELSVRSHNCLQAAGIKYIYELVSKEENEMLKYKNFGRKSLTELVEKLDEMGLHFGMDVDQYLKQDV